MLFFASENNSQLLLSRMRSIVLVLQLSAFMFAFYTKMIDETQVLIGGILIFSYFVLNLVCFNFLKLLIPAIYHFIGDFLITLFLLYVSGGYQNPLSLILIMHLFIPSIFLQKRDLIVYALLCFVGMLWLKTSKFSLNFQDINFIVSFEISVILVSFIMFGFGIWLFSYLSRLDDQNKKLKGFSARIDQYRALGLLASGVCHEMGTPLNTIQMSLDFLKTNKWKQSDIDVIDRNVNKLVDSLKKLNLQVHDQEQKFYEDEFYLLPVLKNFILETQDNLGLRINIYEKISSNVMVKLPKILFLRSIFDVLENSKQANATVVDFEIEYILNRVKIIIKDNGDGFTPKIIKNIAMPFFTSKKNGTGLGLYHFKNLVQMVDGEIHFYNLNGACVEIVLPCSEKSEK